MTLAEAVSQSGWPEGLERYACSLPAGEAEQLRLTLGLRHTGWKAFFSPRLRRAALVIERDLGSVALSLAHEFETVYIVDDGQAQRTVIDARLAALGIQNVRWTTSETLTGPLDAVAIHGIRPEELDAAFVERARSLLVPEGAIYIATVNYGRSVRSILTIRRLLQKQFAGSRTFVYGSSQGIAGAYELTWAGSPRHGLRRQISRLASPLRAPAFGFLAYRDRAPESLLDTVLREAWNGQLVIERTILANPFGLTLIVHEPQSGAHMVLRVPLSTQAVSRNRNNHAAITALHNCGGLITEDIPKPLGAGTGTQTWFAETALAGLPIPSAALKHGSTRQKIAEECAAWIMRLHFSTTDPRVIQGALLDQLIVKPVRKAFAALRGTATVEREAAFEKQMVEAFRDQTLNLVFAHGDYSIDNILVDDREHWRVRGVFDWDVAQPQGLPLLDLLYLLLTIERARSGGAAGAVFRTKILPLDFDAHESALLDTYVRTLGIPARLMLPLAAMAWVMHAGTRTENPERYRCTHESLEIAGDALPVLERLLLKTRPRPCEEVHP